MTTVARMNEPFREMSSLCELDSTKLSNIYFSSLFRCQMDQGKNSLIAVSALKSRRGVYRVLVTKEGESSSSTIRALKLDLNKPLREKKLAGPSTDRHASNPFAFYARSTFEYLIGQQRRQSMPQPVAKSRAKSKLLEVVLEQIELA